jgi:hypothetical protein
MTSAFCGRPPTWSTKSTANRSPPSSRGAVKGPATVRLSTALTDWANGKVPDHPEGHLITVQSLRIFGP